MRCLVFICVFPFIFILTLINDLSAGAPILVSALAMIHGFILISLYNVQTAMEAIDQVGLDDIKLEEFHFEKNAQLFQKSPGPMHANADAQDYLARIARRYCDTPASEVSLNMA